MKKLFRNSLKHNFSILKTTRQHFGKVQTIGIPKETLENERRVSVSPEGVKKLIKMGYEVHVEKDAGLKADFPDSLYKDNGAIIDSK